MQSEFTAIIEEAPEGGYWAICPEVPGANGQGETIKAAKESLQSAVELINEIAMQPPAVSFYYQPQMNADRHR